MIESTEEIKYTLVMMELNKLQELYANQTASEKVSKKEDSKTLLLLCVLASCVSMAISTACLFITLG